MPQLTRDSLTNMLLALPALKDMPGEPADKRRLIDGFINMAVDEIVMAHDWDFAMGVEDETTVADQALYTLKGDSVHEDCRQIFSIRYGSGTNDDGYNLLEKIEPGDLDRKLHATSVSGVTYWMPEGRVNDFPQIKLVEPEDDADHTMRYRYWRRGITFEMLPEGFDWLVFDGVKFYLSLIPWDLWTERKRQMINSYKRPGNEDRVVMNDINTVQRNRHRAEKYGY